MRRFTREQWGELVREQAASGLNIKEFCRQKEVSHHSFYLWRQRFGEQSVNRLPERAQDSAFIPLTLKASTTIGIELPCGATVQVAADDDSLRRVFSALLAAGAKSA